MNRSKNASINAASSVLSNFIIILINFLARTVFIQYLGKEYLGLNGLYTNILSVLSFAELGIGTSINYYLYKPIHDKNNQKIFAYMSLYKKTYRIISVIVLFIGLLILPFLKYFINNMESYGNVNIYVIFVLFLLNSSLTYLNSYKRSLVVANQKKYIDNINHTSCVLILNIIQILILVYSQNYYLFLIIQIIFTIIENIIITNIANKLFPFLKEKSNSSLSKTEKEEIKKSVFANMCHKVGSTFVSSTDNIILSSYISTIIVGVYSNYLMVVSALKTLIFQCFSAITATIGNLAADGDSGKIKKSFLIVNDINYLIVSFCSIVLILLINPFIYLWLGSEYILPFNTVLLIIINFYIYSMRQTLFVYKNSFGLFIKDKYVPFLESVVNIVSSIFLLNYFGINGVLLGTIISSATTVFLVEPTIIYRYVVKEKIRKYYVNYFIKIGCLSVYCFIVLILFKKINFNNSIQHFLIEILIAIVLGLIYSTSFIFINKHILNFIKSKIFKRRK